MFDLGESRGGSRLVSFANDGNIASYLGLFLAVLYAAVVRCTSHLRLYYLYVKTKYFIISSSLIFDLPAMNDHRFLPARWCEPAFSHHHRCQVSERRFLPQGKAALLTFISAWWE